MEIPYTKQAHDLLHAGSLAMADIEHHGFAVDVDYLKSAIKRTNAKVERLMVELESSDVGKLWRKRFKADTNFDSAEQLGAVLFEEMGFESSGHTAKGKQYKTDSDALSLIDHPFARDYLYGRRIKKASSTYLKGILRAATVESRVHCNFNLHTTVTFRSSCDDPNLQNVPVRDPYIMAMIRRAFVPSKGRRIVEIDFSGAEVRVGAAYHKDPVMIDYITNPASDMHRDTAVELFKLPADDVSKAARHLSKNGFVFPQFYGSYYRNCAQKMWMTMVQNQTTTQSGVRLIDHLFNQGIKELGECSKDYKQEPVKGTFEHHLRQIEKSFWEKRFKKYNQWRYDYYDAYAEKGWFLTLTGFVCQGYMTRKDVCSYPIQGSSFHCLLWSIIKLVLHMMPRMGFETRIVCQIHDSIVADVVPEEFDDFIELVIKVTTKLLPREYSWMVVPMEVEVDVCEVGEPWSEKKKYELN